MANLAAQPGEFRFTLTVKRAATGKEEHYEMVGHTDPEKLQEILAKHREAAAAEEQPEGEKS